MKKQTGFTIVELIVIVVIIGVIGLLGWVFFSHMSKSTNVPTTSATPHTKTSDQAAAAITPQDLIAKIQVALAAKYTLYDGDDNNYTNDEFRIQHETFSGIYKPSGYDFFTDNDIGAALYVMKNYPLSAADYSQMEEASALIIKTMTDNGLVSQGPLNGDTNTYEAIYAAGDTTCNTTVLQNGDSSLFTSCGSIKELTETAAATKPMVAVIPNITSSTVVSAGEIMNSETPGYQYVSVGIGSIIGGGGKALLYRKDNGSWVFFQAVQGEVDCADYNTQDLKNAYKGQGCYDSTTGDSEAIVE